VRRRASLLLLVAALLTVSSSGSAVGRGRNVSPKAYVHAICTSVVAWVKDVSSASKTFEGGVKSASTLDEAKAVLVTFLDTAVDLTKTVVARIDNAGLPKAKDGGKVASSFKKVFVAIRDAFVAADHDSAALGTDDPAAFATATKKIGKTLTRETKRAVKLFTGLNGKINTDEVDAAEHRDSACRPLD